MARVQNGVHREAAMNAIRISGMEPVNQELLRENNEILSRFKNDGVDMNKKRELEFSVSLPSKEVCQAFRQSFRDTYSMPKEGMFIFATYPETEEYELVLSVAMVPAAEAITLIEGQFLEISRSFGDADVFWGFSD
tara:strand:- start:1152 stop:1559 length:408 start_codon:yes stop_codon:yes gene_type:complete